MFYYDPDAPTLREACPQGCWNGMILQELPDIQLLPVVIGLDAFVVSRFPGRMLHSPRFHAVMPLDSFALADLAARLRAGEIPAGDAGRAN